MNAEVVRAWAVDLARRCEEEQQTMVVRSSREFPFDPAHFQSLCNVKLCALMIDTVCESMIELHVNGHGVSER